jgi:hypothetical protein
MAIREPIVIHRLRWIHSSGFHHVPSWLGMMNDPYHHIHLDFAHTLVVFLRCTGETILRRCSTKDEPRALT